MILMNTWIIPYNFLMQNHIVHNMNTIHGSPICSQVSGIKEFINVLNYSFWCWDINLHLDFRWLRWSKSYKQQMSKFWTTHSSKEKRLHYLNNREIWIINIKEIEHKNVDGRLRLLFTKHWGEPKTCKFYLRYESCTSISSL